VPVLWTIGHSTHPFEAFLELLEGQRIRVLVDVRTVPRSRRHPQFHSDALARSPAPHGIDYEHLAGLGGWRHARTDSPNGAWRNGSFRGYADHALTPWRRWCIRTFGMPWRPRGVVAISGLVQTTDQPLPRTDRALGEQPRALLANPPGQDCVEQRLLETQGPHPIAE